MSIIRFTIGIIIAVILINAGGVIADHFQLTRTTCIFLGGVLYAIFNTVIDQLRAASETKP